MKKTIRVVKTFKIVKRSCSLNRYYRVTVKIKMGLAGLIFEPGPPNFEDQYNFLRCSSDFLISLLVSDFQRSVWSVQSIPEACACPTTIVFR
jgi:hypothetical protein